jgi:Protein of unknown function (DUF2924)
MIRAVAYKLQEQALGGLSATTRRLLSEDGAKPARPGRMLRPGTVLIRQWQGAAYQVTVAQQGVLYRGEPYRSLSGAVADVVGIVGGVVSG